MKMPGTSDARINLWKRQHPPKRINGVLRDMIRPFIHKQTALYAPNGARETARRRRQADK